MAWVNLDKEIKIVYISCFVFCPMPPQLSSFPPFLKQMRIVDFVSPLVSPFVFCLLWIFLSSLLRYFFFLYQHCHHSFESTLKIKWFWYFELFVVIFFRLLYFLSFLLFYVNRVLLFFFFFWLFRNNFFGFLFSRISSACFSFFSHFLLICFHLPLFCFWSSLRFLNV